MRDFWQKRGVGGVQSSCPAVARLVASQSSQQDNSRSRHGHEMSFCSQPSEFDPETPIQMTPDCAIFSLHYDPEGGHDHNTKPLPPTPKGNTGAMLSQAEGAGPLGLRVR